MRLIVTYFSILLYSALNQLQAQDRVIMNIDLEKLKTEVTSLENAIQIKHDSLRLFLLKPGRMALGKQAWLSTNLNEAVFQDGTAIQEAKSDEEWKAAINARTPAWCYFENDSENGIKYGKLYNWFAVKDPRGLCPDGTSVPSEKEWKELIAYAGKDPVSVLAALRSTTGWSEEFSMRGLDETRNSELSNGFNFQPGGSRDPEGIFKHTQIEMINDSGGPVEIFNVGEGSEGTLWTSADKPMTMAIRLWGTEAELAEVDEGGGHGVRCIEASGKALSSKIQTITRISRELTTLREQLYRARKNQIALEEQMVIIKDQFWKYANLNVDRFQNGDLIPEAKSKKDWKQSEKNQSPMWGYYEGDPNNGTIYGRLYNGYAVADQRGLCPTGWTIPTDADWSALIKSLGGLEKAGMELKSKTNWSGNGNGTNSSGFSALPGGFGIDGKFGLLNYIGAWWSSTRKEDPQVRPNNFYYYSINAVEQVADANGPNSNGASLPKASSLIEREKAIHDAYMSVRCVLAKDNISIKNRLSEIQRKFEESGRIFDELSNNLMRQFGELAPNEKIIAGQRAASIGYLVWRTENLNTAQFANGDPIPEVVTEAQWKAAFEEQRPAWCHYNNDRSFGEKYGKLYNWFAQQDPRGLCPTGWHVPTDAEWTNLIEHMGDRYEANVKLKSKTGWQNSQAGTNESGFNGIPGGYRDKIMGFTGESYYGKWWASDDCKECSSYRNALGYRLPLENLSTGTLRFADSKGNGNSVRCVKLDLK